MNKNEALEEYEYSKIQSKDNIEKGINNDKLKYGYGVRHIQIALFLLCLTVNVMARGHIGVTIVAMTSKSTQNINATMDFIRLKARNESGDAVDWNEKNIIIEKEDIDTVTVANATEQGPEIYNWPKSTQEMVLNAFYLGYWIMMFPIGIICQRYGGKLPLQIALLVNGIVSIVTPCLTVWGNWKAVCFCRIMQGLSQAGTYPSIQALLAKWSPTSERATLSSTVYTGVTLGTIVGYQLAGLLGASSWGWPAIFYAIGVICCTCFILLTTFGVESPLDHKFITEEEKNFIIEDSNDGQKLKTPWRAIVTSKPVWGIIATQIGGVVSFVFFFIQVPSYIHHILGVNVKDSGLLSSLPYVASVFTSLGFGYISDYLTNRKIISTKNARIICNSFSQWGIAFFLILTSYTSNTTIAVTALVLAMATCMGTHAGWMVNTIDLAPNFSGTLMAIGATMSTACILLTPFIVSYVVTDMTNVIQWRIMFFIVSGFACVTNAVFVLLISTDIQPWNNPEYNETCNDEQEIEKK